MVGCCWAIVRSALQIHHGALSNTFLSNSEILDSRWSCSKVWIWCSRSGFLDLKLSQTSPIHTYLRI
jgi:hypothetical protein